MARHPAKTLTAVCILCVAGSARAASPSELPPGVRPLLETAQAINNGLTQTSYAYTQAPDGQPLIQQQEGGWTAYTDCSGWVSYLVGKTLPTQYAAVLKFKTERFPGETKWNWPRAFIWEAWFHGLGTAPAQGAGFTAVTDLRQVRPGDVISWCLGDWCDAGRLQTRKSGKGLNKDTGHILLVMGTAKQVSPASDGAPAVYAVPVLDASDLKHHAAEGASVLPLKAVRSYAGCGPGAKDYDPRAYQPGQTPTCGGVGPGAIHFQVAARGSPTGFQFGPRDAFHPKSPEQGRISIGRPVTQAAVR
ncbi:hypothetical protein KH5H1_28710 [Corallococcus caeni]|uniref:hypothetical protein n=1 Tax=Corallococcus caeni TaxID=3082388 RepID=UPI0029581B98|nr:hypothetical protein KH5H1_28710 [Corallococcus sp. KH5-1]